MRRSFLPLLLVAWLVAGCGSDAGRDGGSPVQPPAEATLSMTLERASASLIPAEADSALVRVWNTRNSVNAVKRVAVPAPGSSTETSFLLPVGEDYNVGVAAYESGHLSLTPGLAFGMTGGVAIRSGQVNRAEVEVRPVAIDIVAPDTLQSSDIIDIELGINFDNTDRVFNLAYLYWGSEPWKSDGGAAESENRGSVGDGMRIPIAVPTADVDTATYFQAALTLNRTGWMTGSRIIRFFSPSVSRGEDLVRVPVVVPNGGLTVIF